MHQKGAERGGTPGQISPCVFAGVDEPGWEDMEGDSCRAAVCSELTSCSICCPEARREAGPCQKEGERHSRATPHAATKPAFTRGSIQNRPTGSRRTGETICSNQGWSFGFIVSNSPLNVVPSIRPHHSKLMELNKIARSQRGGAVSQPGRPASSTSGATLGGSERIKHCNSTSVNPCGAAESKRKAVESHGCFPFFSTRKDRCTQALWRPNGTTEWRQFSSDFRTDFSISKSDGL